MTTSAMPSPVTSPLETYEVKVKPVRAWIRAANGVFSTCVPRVEVQDAGAVADQQVGPAVAGQVAVAEIFTFFQALSTTLTLP